MIRKLDPGSYFGQTTPLHALGGLTVAQTVYPAHFVIPPHEHTNAFFCFVVDGRGTRSWRGRAGAEAPMALTLFPRGHEHANCWHEAGGRALHVEFADPWVERLRGRTKILERPTDFAKGPPIWLAHRLADACTEQDDVSPLIVEALALELLAECTRSQSPRAETSLPPWMNAVGILLRDRFADNLSLAEIAAVAGVSADHLSRTFRLRHGCTIGEYVRKLRVEFACHRLAEADEPLSEVALAAGFADQSHLTKVFRRHMKMTPHAFRMLRGRRRWRNKA